MSDNDGFNPGSLGSISAFANQVFPRRICTPSAVNERDLDKLNARCAWSNGDKPVKNGAGWGVAIVLNYLYVSMISILISYLLAMAGAGLQIVGSIIRELFIFPRCHANLYCQFLRELP